MDNSTPKQSTWAQVLKYFQGDPEAEAVVPQHVVAQPPPVEVVDPYMNFARKATGLPYK